MKKQGNRASHLAPLCAAIILGAAFGTSCSSLPDPSPEDFIDYPTSQVLGKSKSRIDRDMKPLKNKGDGWIQYTRTFSVRFDDGKAVEMREKVPKELGCKEAAKWLGFTRARAPLLEKTRCVWPAEDARHSLGKNVSGIMTLSDHVFKAKRTR